MLERAATNKHFIEDHSQGVYVGTVVHCLSHAGAWVGEGSKMLRGHVGNCSADASMGLIAPQIPGDIEVQ
jgi:hypothetical protein